MPTPITYALSPALPLMSLLVRLARPEGRLTAGSQPCSLSTLTARIFESVADQAPSVVLHTIAADPGPGNVVAICMFIASDVLFERRPRVTVSTLAPARNWQRPTSSVLLA